MKRDAYETEKSTVIVPAAKATMYSCWIVSASKAYASGTVAISPARARSVKIIVCRLRPLRSIHAPAWSAKRRFGVSSAATR
jgi:hypothetical protein